MVAISNLFRTTKKKWKYRAHLIFLPLLLHWGQWGCSLFTPSKMEMTVQSDRFSFSCSTSSRQPKYLGSFSQRGSHIAVWSQMILTVTYLNLKPCLMSCLIHTYMTHYHLRTTWFFFQCSLTDIPVKLHHHYPHYTDWDLKHGEMKLPHRLAVSQWGEEPAFSSDCFATLITASNTHLDAFVHLCSK